MGDIQARFSARQGPTIGGRYATWTSRPSAARKRFPGIRATVDAVHEMEQAVR